MRAARQIRARNSNFQIAQILSSARGLSLHSKRWIATSRLLSELNPSKKGSSASDGMKILWHLLGRNPIKHILSVGEIPWKSKFSHALDHVFGPETSNMQIFDGFARDLVLQTVEGFNGTIFAYGQTSSGKTFTMSGAGSEGSFQPGIIQIGVNELFKRISESPDRTFSVRVSYMEIYNEVPRLHVPAVLS